MAGRYSISKYFSYQPRVVSDLEDLELKRQLAELEDANEEVDGDDDDESEEESGDEEDEGVVDEAE